MPYYELTASVEIQVKTLVEADSEEEAIKIALNREVGLAYNGSWSVNKSKTEWVLDDHHSVERVEESEELPGEEEPLTEET